MTDQPTTRESLIGALRAELTRRANGEMSLCMLAAKNGIFCRGFHRYSDAELRRRYGWISRRYPDISRSDLEEIADSWQMARQEVNGLASACDVQQVEHDSCNGWDDFTNDDLTRFLLELRG